MYFDDSGVCDVVVLLSHWMRKHCRRNDNTDLSPITPFCSPCALVVCNEVVLNGDHDFPERKWNTNPYPDVSPSAIHHCLYHFVLLQTPIVELLLKQDRRVVESLIVNHFL